MGKELRYIKKHAYWTLMGMMCIYMQLPALMQLSVWVTFAAMGGTFSASRIFTAIQLFQLLQQPLQQIPQSLNQFAQLKTSVIRIGAFLRLHELDNDDRDMRVESCAGEGEASVDVSADAVFTWEPKNLEDWQLLV